MVLGLGWAGSILQSHRAVSWHIYGDVEHDFLDLLKELFQCKIQGDKSIYRTGIGGLIFLVCTINVLLQV